MRHQPLWQESSKYPAQLDRTAFGAMWPDGGVRGAAGAPTVNAPEFVVQPGQAAVKLQAGQGTALAVWDGPEAVSFLDPPAPQYGHERTDLVVVRVRDSAFDGGADNDFIVTKIDGVEGTPPVQPAALGPNDLKLFEVTVLGDSPNLNDARIVDCRRPLNPTMEVGGIMPWGTNTMPMGYLPCWGGAVSRRIYKELFDLYGTQWGAGDGSSTFNLPNLTDTFLLGAWSILGLGARGGSRQITQGNMPAHTHSGHSQSHPHDHASHPSTAGAYPSAIGLSSNPSNQAVFSSVFRTSGEQVGIDTWVDAAGGGQDYLPPAVGLHFVIRVL